MYFIKECIKIFFINKKRLNTAIDQPCLVFINNFGGVSSADFSERKFQSIFQNSNFNCALPVTPSRTPV